MLGRFPGPVPSARPSGGTASLSWRCSTPFVGWRRFSAPALRAQDTRSPPRRLRCGDPARGRCCAGLVDAVSAEARRWHACEPRAVRVGACPLISVNAVARAHGAVVSPPGRGAGDPNASSALPAVAGGVPDPPVPPIVDVVDVDEVAHRPLLLVSDICGLTTVTRGPLTGRGLSLRDYSREVAGYRVLEDWAGALILRCRRWCAGQAGIEAPPDIEGASWGSKELPVRDEDVRVLHGFEAAERADVYPTSELLHHQGRPRSDPAVQGRP